jgi:hypothetical protein
MNVGRQFFVALPAEALFSASYAGREFSYSLGLFFRFSFDDFLLLQSCFDKNSHVTDGTALIGAREDEELKAVGRKY